MEPVLSHISALEYWRSVRYGTRNFLPVPDPSLCLAAAPQKSALAEPGPWWLTRPLHVLVKKDSARRTSSTFASHVQGGNLPSSSILDTQNGFYVCSPELCFVQMATILSFPKLVELGFELCGTYDTSTDALRECAPLTTVERLRGYLASTGTIYGKKNATRALRWVANNAASPRESILTMLLCLPYRLGGYGIDLPQLNYRIALGKREQRIAGKSYLVCDLYWPHAKLDVEYDGSDHEDAERMRKDSMRRDALVSMGITVITVTKWQLNGNGINGIAHVVAKQLGKQLRYKDPEFTQKHIALRRELLGR